MDYFRRLSEKDVTKLLDGTGKFKGQSHGPLMLESAKNHICARTFKSKFFDTCRAEPCVIAQLLRNPRAKGWILEAFGEMQFDGAAVYDLLIENLSPEGIVDHGKILQEDHKKRSCFCPKRRLLLLLLTMVLPKNRSMIGRGQCRG